MLKTGTRKWSYDAGDEDSEDEDKSGQYFEETEEN